MFSFMFLIQKKNQLEICQMNCINCINSRSFKRLTQSSSVRPFLSENVDSAISFPFWARLRTPSNWKKCKSESSELQPKSIRKSSTLRNQLQDRTQKFRGMLRKYIRLFCTYPQIKMSETLTHNIMLAVVKSKCVVTCNLRKFIIIVLPSQKIWSFKLIEMSEATIDFVWCICISKKVAFFCLIY